MTQVSRALVCLVALSGCANHDPQRHWIATWTASPQPDDPDPTAPPLQLSNQTIRQIVHVSLGGKRVRLRLSNAYGTTALKLGAVHVALHGSGAAIVSGSDRAVTVNGSSKA